MRTLPALPADLTNFPSRSLAMSLASPSLSAPSCAHPSDPSPRALTFLLATPASANRPLPEISLRTPTLGVQNHLLQHPRASMKQGASYARSAAKASPSATRSPAVSPSNTGMPIASSGTSSPHRSTSILHRHTTHPQRQHNPVCSGASNLYPREHSRGPCEPTTKTTPR